MFYVERKNENRVKKATELAPVFYHKCYICECKHPKKPEIEHRIPKSAHQRGRSLLDAWNQFYSCSYCNGHKGKSTDYYSESNLCPHGYGYLGIIDCTKCDPNNLIKIKIDDEGNVTVEQRDQQAHCVEHTKLLLNKVYGVGVELRDDDLSTLIKEIQEELSRITKLIRRLRNDVTGVNRQDLVKEDKDELIFLMHPRRAFFAFKLSYLQEIRDEAKNAIFISTLDEILSHPSLHPPTTVGYCCIAADKADNG